MTIIFSLLTVDDFYIYVLCHYKIDKIFIMKVRSIVNENTLSTPFTSSPKM